MANDYQNYIAAQSQSRGLDPAAVLAVASTEGGFGGPSSAPGDNGTSFGPFQLHIGGALPKALWDNPSAAQAWAWSEQGINYALDQIAKVAGGLKGQDAISNIVARFERPADPTSEINKAGFRYSQFGQSGRVSASGLPIPGVLKDFLIGKPSRGFDPVGGLVSSAESIAAPITAIPDFIAKITDPNFILRALQVVAGGAMVLVGLALLVRQIGLSASVPTTAGKAASRIQGE